MVRESVNNLGGLTSQLKLIGSPGTKGGDKNTTVQFAFWRVSRGQNAIFSNIVVHLDMFCSAKLGGKPQEAIQVVAFFPKVSFVEENCFCYCVSPQFNMMFNFGVKMKKKRDFLPAFLHQNSLACQRGSTDWCEMLGSGMQMLPLKLPFWHRKITQENEAFFPQF